MAGFEGGMTALNCALQGIRAVGLCHRLPERFYRREHGHGKRNARAKKLHWGSSPFAARGQEQRADFRRNGGGTAKVVATQLLLPSTVGRWTEKSRFNTGYYRAAGFVKLASMYPGLLP